MSIDRSGVEPSGSSDPLPVGRQIGGYRILEQIGVGGMGEVYRAKDTRLGRDVAIKILPKHRAGDPEREHRFLREAQAASALNHPNILSVYDIGADDGITFIVSEFIPGAPLSDRIRQGGIPIKELIGIAAQIADGLAAAHQARIVHRDLKPDNIIVTPDGRVKILDFGLAKTSAVSESLREMDPSLPARTATEAGFVLGSVPYMSPEQARGAAVDYRSDQFSLGIVIYELSTGVHPFRRDAPVQTLSAIIGDEATPLAQVNAKIPTPLAWIIERCLAKDAQLRYASTVDLAHDLAALRDRQWSSAPASYNAQSRRSIRGVPLAIVGGALAIATGVILGLTVAERVFPAVDLAAYRFTPVATEPGFQGGPALAPNLKTIAYLAEVDGFTQVFVRRFADASAPSKPLFTRAYNCSDLFWSSDSEWIYFISQVGENRTGLFRVSAVGGDWKKVMDDVTTAAMSPDGKTIAFLRNDDPMQLGQGSGQQTLWLARAADDALDPEWKEERYRRPPFDTNVASGVLHFSPDGTMLAAWVQPWYQLPNLGTAGGKLYVIPLSGAGDPRQALAWLPDRPAGEVQFTWLPDSRHIVAALIEHGAGTHLSLVDLNRDSVRRLTMGTERENYPSVSPLEPGKIAFTQERAHLDVIEIRSDGKGQATTVLGTSNSESNPSWSARANAFAYVTDRNGKPEIFRRSYDGGANDEPLVRPADLDGPTNFLGDPAYSPDGLRLAYVRAQPRQGWKIWIYTIGGAAQPLFADPPGSPVAFEDLPTWSHDNWIAFNRTEAQGRRRLLKAHVGSGQAPTTIYPDIGPYPCPWSPDGHQLACQTSEGLTVITSEGAKVRVVTTNLFLAYDWDQSGTSINGLRTNEDGVTVELVSIDVKTSAERILNRNVERVARVGLPIRGFSKTSHGTFLTSIARLRSEIYLMDGLKLPGPFSDWLGWLLGRRP